MRRSIVCFLSCLLTPLLAGAVFVASVWWLPVSPTSSSTAGRVIAGWLGQFGPWVCWERYEGEVLIQRGDRFVVVERPNPPSRTDPDGPTLVHVNFQINRTESGLWAPTTRDEDSKLLFEGPSLAPQQQLQARRAFVDFAMTRWPSPELAELRDGDVSRITILWSGWFHNAASLAAFVIFAVSAPMAGRSVWRILRTPPGHCPHCRYDLRGTPPAAPCPECGRPSQRS